MTPHPDQHKASDTKYLQFNHWSPKSKAIEELLNNISAFLLSETDNIVRERHYEDLSLILGAVVCQDTDLEYIAEVARYYSLYERGLREWEVDVYFLLLKNNKIATTAISRPLVQRLIEPAILWNPAKIEDVCPASCFDRQHKVCRLSYGYTITLDNWSRSLLKDQYLQHLPGWRLTNNIDGCFPWYLVGVNKAEEEDPSETFQSAALVAASILHDRLLLRLIAQKNQIDTFKLEPDLAVYFIACSTCRCKIFCMKVRTDNESAQPGQRVRYSLTLLQSFNLAELADTREFAKCLDAIHGFGATMHRESIIKDTAAAQLNMILGQNKMEELQSMTLYHDQPNSITWKANEDAPVTANWDGEESTLGSRSNSPSDGDESREDMKDADLIECFEEPEKPARLADLTEQLDISGQQYTEGARSSCPSDNSQKAECPLHATGKPNISAMGRIFHGRKSREKCETCRISRQRCFNVILGPEAWARSSCEILRLFRPPPPCPAI